MPVGFAQGLNASLSQNNANDTIRTLSNYKTNQDTLRLRQEELKEKARMFNEELALKAQEVGSNIAFKDQQTAELIQKNEVLKQQIEEMQRSNLRRDFASQFYGGQRAQNYSRLNQFIAGNQDYKDALEIGLGSSQINAISQFSDSALLGANSKEIVAAAKQNPSGYVVIGTADSPRIVEANQLAAFMGVYNDLNAEQLKSFTGETNKTLAEIAKQQAEQGDATNAFINITRATLPKEGTDLTKAELTAQSKILETMQNQQEKAEKRINVDNLRSKNIEVIYDELSKLTSLGASKQQAEHATAELMPALAQIIQSEEEKAGRELTNKELDERLGGKFSKIVTLVKRFDPIGKTFEITTDGDKLLQETQNTSSLLVDTLKSAELRKAVAEGRSISDFLAEKANVLLPIWQSFNSMFGGGMLSDREFLENTKQNAQFVNFQTAYLKYLSGVASRADEFNRVKDMLGSFGNSPKQNIALLSNFVSTALNRMDTERRQNPYSFSVFKREEYARVQAMKKTLGLLEQIQSAKGNEKKRLMEELRNTNLSIADQFGFSAEQKPQPEVSQNKKLSLSLKPKQQEKPKIDLNAGW